MQEQSQYLTILSKNMRIIIGTVIMLLMLESCDNTYDLIIKQSDGTTKKFICRNDADTLNSTVYRFYDWLLISKWTYVNGKIEGSMFNYHADGTINIITNFINDTVHGINKVYNDSGNLIRRSFYIKNKQVLFESIMINEDFPNVIRKKIQHKNKSNKVIWAGDIFLDKNNLPTNIGIITDKMDSIIADYKGMYVDIIIDDTIAINNDYNVILDITLPNIYYSPEIIIGEFDVNMLCYDTIFYTKSDSIGGNVNFKFHPSVLGNNYLIGRLNSFDSQNDDIYFFKGFYVRP